MPFTDRESLTRQIRDGVDIADLISGYMTLRRAGANFKGLCPFHEEKTPSFNVSPSKQIFKCYGCGAGGDVFSFIQLREKVDFVEARRILADRAGISLEKETATPSGAGPGKSELFRVNDWAMRLFRHHFLGSAGETARKYVADRGINEQTSESFHLGLALDSYDALLRAAKNSKVDVKLLDAAGLIKARTGGGNYDTFRHRLIFPIADAAGRIIGFGGRTLGDDPAKYLNTPSTLLFDKSSNLFGLDRARHGIAQNGRAIVVEGYTDCIMAHQCGFTETIATLGTAMTEAHAGLLRRYTDRVILLFDSDEAGQRAADRALSVSLTGRLDVSLARVPEGKDPCDYLLSAGEEAFASMLKVAVPALEFKWHLVAGTYQASATGPARRRAIESFLQELATWIGQGAIDPIQMGYIVNQLSKILSLPAEELHRQLTGWVGKSSASVKARNQVQSGDAENRHSHAEQEAYRQLLEMLLNEPHRYAEVEDILVPSAIRDPALSAVAQHMIPLLRSDSAFTLSDLIRHFESPAFGELITDLQTRGEHRGNFAEVIEGARACLESTAQLHRTWQLAGAIRDDQKESGKVENEEEKLSALADSAKHPHFASARARRRILEL